MNSTTMNSIARAVAMAAITAASAQAGVLTDNRSPLAEWEFDLGSSSITDLVGNNDGAIMGPGVMLGTWAGEPGANFATSDLADHIRFDHRSQYELAEGAIAIRFQQTGHFNDREALFSKDAVGYESGGHLTIQVHANPGETTNGYLEVRLQSSSQSYSVRTGTLQLSTWYDMEFSFGSDGMRLSLDNVVVDTDSYTGGLTGNTEPLALGVARWWSPSGTWSPLYDKYSGYISGFSIHGPVEPFIYCSSSPNSLGLESRMDFTGSISLADGNFQLVITDLPPNQPGYLFYGTNQANTPFGDGVRCLGSPLVRYKKIPNIGPTGSITVPFDFTTAPLGSGPNQILAGTDYYFQMWYRDPAAGSAGFNTTEAMCVRFVP